MALETRLKCAFYVIGCWLHTRRKLKKLLRRRKSELDSKQEEELNKTLQRHERNHILGPFVGLSPEYMEMSESEHKAFVNKYINIHNMHMAAVLCQVF